MPLWDYDMSKREYSSESSRYSQYDVQCWYAKLVDNGATVEVGTYSRTDDLMETSADVHKNDKTVMTALDFHVFATEGLDFETSLPEQNIMMLGLYESYLQNGWNK